jgi:alkylation response protein AidB-like acyl-CoA dehydrogenase
MAMHFGFTPEQEALRQDVRAFIAEHLTPEVQTEIDGLSDGFGVRPGRVRGGHVEKLFASIGERGWLGISYPTEYGGRDGDRINYITGAAKTRQGRAPAQGAKDSRHRRFSGRAGSLWSPAQAYRDQGPPEADPTGRRTGPAGQMLCFASVPRIRQSRAGSSLF